MDFRFSEEEARFRQEVRDFCEKELPSDWIMGDFFAEEALETEEEWAFYRSLKRKLGSKGWLSLQWPREYGGQESRMKYVILEEELTYYGVPALDCTLTYAIVAPTILAHGTEEQKRKHLPPIAKGETLWCQGFSEPNAGSDLASLSTRAVEQGDYFVVDGQKCWATLGHHADWGLFLLRTDTKASRHRGLSMFLVDVTTPGITRSPVKNLLGHNVWAEVFFDGVRIPRENMVGGKNQGWEVTTTTLNNERSGIKWLAASRRSLDRMVKYVSERRVLAQNPMIRHRLAQLAIEVELSRLFCYYVEWLRVQGKPLAHEASMTKVYCAHLSGRVAEAGVQILGLYGGLDKGSKWAPLAGAVAQAYLGYLPWTIAGGSPEIQKNIIATAGLGLPRSV